MGGTCARRFSICDCSRPARSSKKLRACTPCDATSRGSKPASRNYARRQHDTKNFPTFNSTLIIMADETTTPTTTATGTAAPSQADRGNRKDRIGEVISNKMAKTIIVRVERRFPHPKYKKVVTGYKKFYAHDEKGEAKVGDRVRIEETRPLSKTKRWRLVEVVARSSGVAPVGV